MIEGDKGGEGGEKKKHGVEKNKECEKKKRKKFLKVSNEHEGD